MFVYTSLELWTPPLKRQTIYFRNLKLCAVSSQFYNFTKLEQYLSKTFSGYGTFQFLSLAMNINIVKSAIHVAPLIEWFYRQLRVGGGWVQKFGRGVYRLELYPQLHTRDPPKCQTTALFHQQLGAACRTIPTSNLLNTQNIARVEILQHEFSKNN